jgi:hypothetical protein
MSFISFPSKPKDYLNEENQDPAHQLGMVAHVYNPSYLGD